MFVSFERKMEKKDCILTDEDYDRIENLFIDIEPSSKNISDLISKMTDLDLVEDIPNKIVTSYYHNSHRGIEFWEGYLLGVKIIIRPDGFVMIFVVSRTCYDGIMKKLAELSPRYITQVNYKCYMWRDTPGECLRLFEKIKDIDPTLRQTGNI